MRVRVLLPTVVLAFAVAGCGSVASESAPSTTARKVSAAIPALRPSDPVLIVGGLDGTVSVRTTTGQVAFRAPFAKAAPDSSTVVQAEPMDAGTRIVASDPITGVPRWTHDVTGTRKIRVVSPGGRNVAAIDGNLNTAQQPRASTNIDIVTAKGSRRITLAGNLDPEAFSVDGRYLYTLDFLPAMQPTRYSVRRIDLQTLQMTAVPDRNGSVRAPMPGYSYQQVMSPDGRQLYTFYASNEAIHVGHESYHAWIHVLNLDKGWAHCLELDEKIGLSGSANPALAVSPDGSRLFVTDGTTHAIAAIDTTTLRVVRMRFLPMLANTDEQSLLATDGNTVYARTGYAGVSAFDARTLTPAKQRVPGTAGISALRLDGSGQELYLLTTSSLVVIDRAGRVLHRWASPGNAMSIDPSVVVPGSGSYRCAC